uniref:Protein EXECUTER 2, chloroplastic n=1 Tax=Ananas comosus var. bracteatus TaxID=296719 RepID=A0A6V7QI17_ANACO|nr:unnamed protein product [Ananas comosus var. bracteatus]
MGVRVGMWGGGSDPGRRRGTKASKWRGRGGENPRKWGGRGRALNGGNWKGEMGKGWGKSELELELDLTLFVTTHARGSLYNITTLESGDHTSSLLSSSPLPHPLPAKNLYPFGEAKGDNGRGERVGVAAPPPPPPQQAAALHLVRRPSAVVPAPAGRLTLGGGAVLRRRLIALRNGRNPSSLCCRCSAASSAAGGGGGGGGSGFADWDWSRWSRHFSEIDQAENYASVLKFQLEEAIEKEDFSEAAKLKRAITEATSKDTVAEVMSELKNAIEEQRYHDASRLRRVAGTGLVGWWVGYAKDSDDPFGRIVRITPSVGRYVARSYSPRQLLTESSGTPLFEIFLIKDDDGTYTMQVVSLQSVKGNSTLSASSPSKSTEDSTKVEVENPSIESPMINEATKEKGNDGAKAKTNEEISEKEEDVKGGDAVNSKDNGEDGLKSVIKFLKERIPGFKVQVLDVSVPEEIKVETEIVEQLAQENDEKADSSEDSADETADLENDQQEEETLPVDEASEEAGKDSKLKLFIGECFTTKRMCHRKRMQEFRRK